MTAPTTDNPLASELTATIRKLSAARREVADLQFMAHARLDYTHWLQQRAIEQAARRLESLIHAPWRELTGHCLRHLITDWRKELAQREHAREMVGTPAATPPPATDPEPQEAAA